MFSSRPDAGKQLAVLLASLKEERPVVLGVSKRGIPVAAEVARALDAPFEVLVVRRVNAPWTPEVALGAVAENGALYIEPRAAAFAALSDDELDSLIALRRNEIHRRTDALREGRKLRSAEGRTLILVDDGVVSGATAHAALLAAQRLNPARMVLAVPVAQRDSAKILERYLDRLVALERPEHVSSVDAWYADHAQVTDDDVRSALAHAPARYSYPVPAGTHAPRSVAH